jgi:hypothetical protein
VLGLQNPIDWVKKFGGLLADSTVGLVRQYQKKSMEFVKIQAAALYIQGIKSARNLCLTLSLVVFLFSLAAVGLVAVSLTLVLMIPMPLAAKITGVLLLGVLYVGGPAIAVFRILSDKNWMKFTGAADLLEKATNGH